MSLATLRQSEPDPLMVAFYREAIRILQRAGQPFLVGGAYALNRYTGIERHTKDFDIFVRPQDAARVLDLMVREGYRTELTFPHWLGKVFHYDAFIDVIFGSGNGLAPVDDAWFEHAVADQVFGIPVQLCSAEEMVWSKAFIMERERYDGADIAHLLRAYGSLLDWEHLLRRFTSFERVLLNHVLLFGFIYPTERAQVPDWVTERLWDRVRSEERDSPTTQRLCQGTLLSREQYLIDIETWGYLDARLPPRGKMSPEEIARWTAGIDWGKRT